MYILITYDINTTDHAGNARLRKVAKICMNYGQRVQNSVFECKVDEGQYLLLKQQLFRVINKERDNLRFYRLGKNYQSSIESIGVNFAYDIDEPLII